MERGLNFGARWMFHRRSRAGYKSLLLRFDVAAKMPPGDDPLKAWRQQVLAYFDTSGVSNGGTEAINLIIEKIRRLAHGFRDFDHYRLRILLAASGNRAYRG